MTTLQSHIVGYPYQGWGHARPLINLVARFVRLRPVTVTLIAADGFYDRIKNELARSFDADEEELAARIRVIAIGDVQFFSPDGDDHFKKAWKSIIAEEELVCTKTGTRYTPLPKPKAIIIDFFAVEPFNSIKALSGNTAKVFSWYPGLTYAIFHLFGPEHLGGKGNLRLLIEEEARRTGRPFKEIAEETVFAPTGKLVRVPGMPPMYDHEHHPQVLPPVPDGLFTVLARVYETLEASDGLLMITPTSYEPEAVATAKAWFAETGRPAYAVGPLLPSASKATAAANEKKQSAESSQIQEFLDATLKSSGEKSLVYISFGSMFWPSGNPDSIWAALEVIMELNIPFILSHASPFAAKIPDEIQEKVKAYGKGVLSPWTPQQLILDHPATGWFIAHGGHNGVTEAISAGVPQIVWPFGGDQSQNAVHIADQLQIGYELLEVRTGNGLKPIYRTGYTPKGTIEAIKAEVREVLQKAFGEDGAKKRARLEVLRKVVNGEWEEGGTSRKEASEFLDSL